MKETRLDDTFWSRFAKNNWERKPLMLRNIKSDLLELDESEIFKLIVKAADRSRREKNLLGFKFFVGGIRSSDVETLFVLPRKSDKSFLGYNERMERMYQDYCLVCDELLQVNREKQSLLTQFTRDLYRHVGFSNRFAEMGLYLGNYRKTPFGVHRDLCGVFSFPVVGTKKFRAWSPEYVAKNPALEQSFRYSKHNAESLVLEGEVGDMMYWPSASWHIAESNGSFSATWSLGVWVDRPTSELVSETLVTLLTDKMDERISASTISVSDKSERAGPDGEVRSVPDVFDAAIATLKQLTREDLHSAFRATWLKRLSGSGLKTLAKSDAPFAMNKTLKLREVNAPILWTLLSDSKNKRFKFSYAFGDSGLNSSTSRELLKLIKSLNAGATVEAAKVLNGKNKLVNSKSLKLLGDAGAFQ